MPADIGTQTVTVKFFDPVDSPVANRIGLDVRKPGLYSGGYMTKVSDVLVTLSTMRCEIGDGTYQVGISTAATFNAAIASATPYIVLRWAYTGVAAADYMQAVAVAVGSIATNDVVVGKGSFSGSTLTGFDYTLRTTPAVQDLFLKVEPEETPSLYCRVRAGRANYGEENYDIVDQVSPLFTAPVSNSSISLLQVNAAGALSVVAGTPAASPVAPDYGGLVTLAEVTLAVGATTITAAKIKDVRNFVGGSVAGVVTITGDQTITGLKTFSGGHIIENRTSDPGGPSTGQIWIRTDL